MFTTHFQVLQLFWCMLKVRMGTSTSDLSVLLQENCHICLVEDTVPHSSVKITTVIRLLGLLPFHTTFPERTVPGSDSTLFYPHEIKVLLDVANANSPYCINLPLCLHFAQYLWPIFNAMLCLVACYQTQYHVGQALPWK